jgi:disulfide bond formation protein DsbB
MSRATFFFRAAQLNILVLCGVLLGGFAFQFVSGELPCPLCMLQRHAMMLCALGPAFLIARAHHGEMQYRDVATGYGLAVLAAVAAASVSVRQILSCTSCRRIPAMAGPSWGCTCTRGPCWYSSAS